MKKKCFILFVILISDLIYSFLQYYYTPLDGDMAAGLVPSLEVQKTLSDPFGFSVIKDNAVYCNPNRFFAHWEFYTYFNNVPFWLQSVVSPIESVYVSSAIAKLSIHLLFLLVLSFFIVGKRKVFSAEFLIVALLLTPLFLTNGLFRSFMGIINPSVTYLFFYSLPTVLLLLFYLPFYSDANYSTRFLKKPIVQILLLIGAVCLPFNGALNPGIILIITFVYGLKVFSETDRNISFGSRIKAFYNKLPKAHILFFSIICFTSIYALYIGKNNAIFIGETTLSYQERYVQIFKGIFVVFIANIGSAILLTIIAGNIFILKKTSQAIEVKQLMQFVYWFLIFVVCYLLLLPLGGYKEYRPYILRDDTAIPITIGWIYIFAKSSFLLLKNLQGKANFRFKLFLASIFVFYSISDRPWFKQSDCERAALHTIAQARHKQVALKENCTVLSWKTITKPEKSILNGKLLKKWHITKDEKTYYCNSTE